jgi:hypothetical protein
MAVGPTDLTAQANANLLYVIQMRREVGPLAGLPEADAIPAGSNPPGPGVHRS